MKWHWSGVVFILLITGCHFQDDPASFHDVDPAPYNEQLRQARARLDTWANDPVDATRHLFEIPPGEGRSSTSITVETVKLESIVTFTQEGISDDSVDGERVVITFRKKGWSLSIAKISKGYKCADGRGHTHYSGAPCS